MKDVKTRLSRVVREFFLEQFEAMWEKLSALDALIREVKLSIQIRIQIKV